MGDMASSSGHWHLKRISLSILCFLRSECRLHVQVTSHRKHLRTSTVLIQPKPKDALAVASWLRWKSSLIKSPPKASQLHLLLQIPTGLLPPSERLRYFTGKTSFHVASNLFLSRPRPTSSTMLRFLRRWGLYPPYPEALFSLNVC